MSRVLAFCPIVVLAALGFMAPTSEAEAAHPDHSTLSFAARNCGQMPNQFAFNVRARNLSCGKARRVVRRWGQTAARKRGGDGWVFGLYCNYRNTGYEAGVIRCARRERVVRWQTAS